MPAITVITDEDLARSRTDPEFRHRLVAGSLETLLGELKRLRNGTPDSVKARQIREGVDLAVHLAAILQRIEQVPL